MQLLPFLLEYQRSLEDMKKLPEAKRRNADLRANLVLNELELSERLENLTDRQLKEVMSMVLYDRFPGDPVASGLLFQIGRRLVRASGKALTEELPDSLECPKCKEGELDRHFGLDGHPDFFTCSNVKCDYNREAKEGDPLW